jgi:putative spermidine/putrescine transport system permease protein
VPSDRRPEAAAQAAGGREERRVRTPAGATGRGRTAGWLFVLPVALVMALGFLWPLGGTFVNSFHPNTPAGIAYESWTGANYAKLLDPYYASILQRTLRISLIVSGITVVLAYPVAIFVAGLSPRAQAWVILGYASPWLVNVVVKSFGWSLLLRSNGIINTALASLGLIDTPLRLMLNETGIVIALIPGHFMFVLLPLWAAVQGLDPALAWAARGLGAPPWKVFAKITLPLTAPALIAGLVINFTMNMTAFAAPAILGGARARVLSYLAFQVNLEQLNWPLGSAIAVAMLAFTLLFVWVGQRLGSLGLRRSP